MSGLGTEFLHPVLVLFRLKNHIWGQVDNERDWWLLVHESTGKCNHFWLSMKLTRFMPPLYRKIVIERFALQQRFQRGFIVHLQNNETGRWFGREENMFRSQKYANFCESIHNLQLQSIYFTTRPSGKVIS